MDSLRPCLQLCMWSRDWRDSQCSNFIHPPCSVWSLTAMTRPEYTHIHTEYLFTNEHTERSLKINACMHKLDVQKHKLHTHTHICTQGQTQRCVHVHTQRHTNTKHTSRLSLCFQLPDGPRGNQNFDTPGWKRRAGKPGSARGVHVHVCVHAYTQTHSSGAHRLSLSFQAGDRPRCTENVKTWHWGEEKSCVAQFATMFFFFSSSCLKGGECVWEGLVNYYDLTTYFYFMKQFIAAHKGISQRFALGCTVYLSQRGPYWSCA